MRPQFHFTAKKNWLNDPNGCVYYQGQYHLFFQHNPESVEWGHMTWGHAVSSDLIHWEQKANAIRPDELGTIYSGSAVVDHQNSSGFQTGKEPPLVAAFTYAGEFGTPPKPYTQALAYSNNSGRTWTKYGGSPVLPNQSGGGHRDPKLLWHEDTKRWVMVLYLCKERTLGFFKKMSSPCVQLPVASGSAGNLSKRFKGSVVQRGACALARSNPGQPTRHDRLAAWTAGPFCLSTSWISMRWLQLGSSTSSSYSRDSQGLLLVRGGILG